ncbi:MAG TPA: histidinol-phosphate transaminase [Acidimicrobiia bacterium]|nr:histidinol-phosphate transaminase [Acidimicrobiia bacterium]
MTSSGSARAWPQPRDDLRELAGYHSPQLDVAVRLNTNESPYPPPAEFVAALSDAMRAVAYHRYPDRAARSLRSALGEFVGQPPERIFVANGSNEVLQTVLLTYAGAGRRALVFEPTYALHAHIARITGTTLVTGTRRADFTVDPDGAARLVHDVEPAVVFVCSPNNPTGTVEPAATVESLLAAARAVGALLVVDEAYGEFAPWSALALLDDDAPLAVVRTYSKVWSLAAMRLGFALAPAAVVAELEKVVLPYHLSIGTQLAGRLALDHRGAMLDRVASLVSERERLTRELGSFSDLTVFPSGANFVLVRIAGDAQRVWESLVARGVLVRNFASWPGVEGCLRISVGTPDENDAFLAALRASLQEVPQ